MGLLAILAVCFEMIPRFPFGPYTLYGDLTPEQRAAKIPYDHLSSEETEPYFKAPEYHSAVRRWPNVRACLVASQRKAETPDLRLIDWDRFANYDEAKVCLWRIFASLGARERIAQWMVFHGYRVAPLDSSRFQGWTVLGEKKWTFKEPTVPSRGLMHWLLKIHPLHIPKEKMSVTWRTPISGPEAWNRETRDSINIRMVSFRAAITK